MGASHRKWKTKISMMTPRRAVAAGTTASAGKNGVPQPDYFKTHLGADHVGCTMGKGYHAQGSENRGKA